MIDVDHETHADEDEGACEGEGEWVGAEEFHGGSAGRDRAVAGWPLRCSAKERGAVGKRGFEGVKGTRCWSAKGGWIWKR